MAFLKVANNAVSTLAAALTEGATTVTLAAGGGALFPATPQFDISIDKEVMRVTAIAGDSFTVERHVQSSSAQAHAEGAAVELRVTAKVIEDLNAAVATLEGKGSLTLGEIEAHLFVHLLSERLARSTGAEGKTLALSSYLGSPNGITLGDSATTVTGPLEVTTLKPENVEQVTATVGSLGVAISKLSIKALTPSIIKSDRTDYTQFKEGKSFLRVSAEKEVKMHGGEPPSEAGKEGAMILVSNVGTFTINLINQSGTCPTAAHRFILPNEVAELALKPNEQRWFTYDTTTERWRIT